VDKTGDEIEHPLAVKERAVCHLLVDLVPSHGLAEAVEALAELRDYYLLVDESVPELTRQVATLPVVGVSDRPQVEIEFLE